MVLTCSGVAFSEEALKQKLHYAPASTDNPLKGLVPNTVRHGE